MEVNANDEYVGYSWKAAVPGIFQRVDAAWLIEHDSAICKVSVGIGEVGNPLLDDLFMVL